MNCNICYLLFNNMITETPFSRVLAPKFEEVTKMVLPVCQAGFRKRS